MAGQAQSLDTVLVSCIIFICLENLLGNVEGAIQHLHSGLEILRSWKNGDIKFRKEMAQNCDESEIETSVVPILEHLNQVTFIYGRLSPPLPYEPMQYESPNAHEFQDFQEARSALRRLLTETQSLAVEGAKPLADIPVLTNLRDQLLVKYEKWTTLFGKLFRPNRSQLARDTKLRNSVLMLQIQKQIGSIWLQKIFSVAETSHDAFYKEYKFIVDISEIILSPETSSSDNGIRGGSDYSFKTQVTTPLWVTAMKCRNPTLRRRAVDLLRRAPKRRGFWSSDAIIKVAERIIEIEEAGLEDLKDETGEVVPSEWSRHVYASITPPTGDRSLDGSKHGIVELAIRNGPPTWDIVQEEILL